MAFSMRIVCFVDSDFSDDYALLRLDETLFLQYNCGKGYNVDTEVPNTLTITRAKGEMEVSERLASLAPGRSYAFLSGIEENWGIRVCSIHRGDIDYAEISVYRADEQHRCAVEQDGGRSSKTIWALVVSCIVLACTILAGVFYQQYFRGISVSSMGRKRHTSPNLPGKLLKTIPKESTC
jgi:hypothetical protein